jgi:hypothetical protein
MNFSVSELNMNNAPNSGDRSPVLRNLISYNLLPQCCDRAAGYDSDGPDRKLMPRGNPGFWSVCSMGPGSRDLCTAYADSFVRMRMYSVVSLHEIPFPLIC